MLIAFILIFSSSLFQALWTIFAKGSAKTSTVLLANLFGGILFMPLWFFVWKDLGQIVNILWLLLFSGIVNALVFWLTIHVYSIGGDVSFATPMMAACSILGGTCLSLIIGLFSHSPVEISPLAYCGYGLIVLGCLILPVLNFKEVRLRDYFNSVTLLCLFGGFAAAVSVYLDSRSIHILSNDLTSFQKSIIFICPFRIATVIGLIPFLWFDKLKYGVDFTKEKPDYKEALKIGFSCTFAYLLVCAAYPFVKDASYIVALRLMAIPMAMIGGVVAYKERMYIGKTLGSALMIIGLIMTTFG